MFGFSSCILTSYATTKFQLQDWMEEMYLKHQSKELLRDMINSIDNNTNLHQTALEVARLNKLSSLHDGINFVIDDLTAKF